MSEIKYKRIMLKVSGEALAGPAHRGLDFDVIHSVCSAIKECFSTVHNLFRRWFCVFREEIYLCFL